VCLWRTCRESKFYIKLVTVCFFSVCDIIPVLSVTLFPFCLWHYSCSVCDIVPVLSLTLFLFCLWHCCCSVCDIVPVLSVTLFLFCLWHYSCSVCIITSVLSVTLFLFCLWHYSCSVCDIVPVLSLALFLIIFKSFKEPYRNHPVHISCKCSISLMHEQILVKLHRTQDYPRFVIFQGRSFF